MIEFNFNVIDLVGYLIIPVVLPLLVGLVTTKETNGNRKAIMLASLAMVTSLLTQALSAWQAGTPYDLWVGLLGVVPTFVIAVATHYGLWNPTGMSNTVQGVGDNYMPKHAAVAADDAGTK